MASKRFLIAGLGHFGSAVALSLRQLNHRVLVIDVSRQQVEKVAEIAERAIVGDATDVEVLESIGVEATDTGIVSMGQDVTASVLTTVALRDLGLSEIFVKVISDLHARIVGKVGIAESIFPERKAAELLARRLASRSILHYAELGPGFSAEELAVPKGWVGKTLRQLELPRRYNVSVIAVKDYLTGTTRPVPDPDSPLKDSDTLFLAGTEESLGKFSS